MPPRRTRKKAAARAPRRAKKGNYSAWLVVALTVFALLAGIGFYLFNQERGKHESIAEKARQIARENPNAEVFTNDANRDADVKKK
ncbi:MAG: hypothetical protein LBD30_01045 [Verrucomicrobiales bacterium]|jgi:uncharacterized protein HemX|nr:hypothetical protein [Verrucomicrobiales bacterium]